MRKYKTWHFYYDNREVFGIRALFYVLLGGRGIGKTFRAQNYCLRQFFKKGRKTLWLRLKEPSVKALLANDAADFIDTKLIEKWHITKVKVKNNTVWISRNYGPEREFAKILALSTYYIQKGVALNKSGQAKKKNKERDDAVAKAMITKDIRKYYNIVLDELNQERSEKKTFDISYAFVNQLETVCRLDKDRRIILCGNTLEEGSDILSRCFNFIPNDFGIYRLKNKRAVIHYIEDSDKYKEARKNSIAGILMPHESTFTNVIESDIQLITKKDPGPQSSILKFDNKTQFVLCGDVITKQKVPSGSKLPVIALRPYITGIPYYKDQADVIIQMAQQRHFKFDMLLTLKQFYTEIKLLKPN